MKEIPILFSTPMVQALLEGRKTQTRRIIKHQPIKCTGPSIDNPAYINGDFIWADPKNSSVSTISCRPNGPVDYAKNFSPYGQPGDVLWVREKIRRYWVTDPETGEPDFNHIITDYATDKWEPIPMFDGDGCQVYLKNGTEKMIPWKPGIHMKKIYCRIWLQVESVRVERLHSISEEDAIAEGILIDDEGLNCFDYIRKDYRFIAPQDSFETLWLSINGSESWDANPWVWVVKFRRVEKP